jgi:hypothetical protein
MRSPSIPNLRERVLSSSGFDVVADDFRWQPPVVSGVTMHSVAHDMNLPLPLIHADLLVIMYSQ